PGERRESLQHVLGCRQFPVEFDMRDRARHQHDVARTVTENPVSDANVAALGVLGLRFHACRAFGGTVSLLRRPFGRQKVGGDPRVAKAALEKMPMSQTLRLLQIYVNYDPSYRKVWAWPIFMRRG